MAEPLLDWPALMRLGLHQLGLHPDQFWALTPMELSLMAGISPGTAAHVTRARLNALCAEFPDRPSGGSKDET